MKTSSTVADIIQNVLASVALQRIREIEGRDPSLEEFAEHHSVDALPDGRAIGRWKGEPIVTLTPPYYYDNQPDVLIHKITSGQLPSHFQNYHGKN